MQRPIMENTVGDITLKEKRTVELEGFITKLRLKYDKYNGAISGA